MGDYTVIVEQDILGHMKIRRVIVIGEVVTHERRTT